MTAVQKARERIGKDPLSPDANKPAYIFVKSEYRILKIELKDILYFESSRDYVAIHTSTGKILTLQSLRSFEETLDGNEFLRIHKSYIIALDKISAIERKRVVIQDTYLPVGDTYLESFWKKLPVR